MDAFIRDFQIIRPQFERSQAGLLEWIATAHARSGGAVGPSLQKIGLGPTKIASRGFSHVDYSHESWEEMQLMTETLGKRMEHYETEIDQVFERFFPVSSPLPPHLIHVTCTGYVSPSPAQKLVSNRGFGQKALVTHAYHMGCYAALPAIRIALGHLSFFGKETGVVHTEVSSLHFDSSLHSTEQLVIQSLFADGFIKYTVGDQGEGPSFEIKGFNEEVIEGSIDAMSWACDSKTFKMGISREVPVHIRRAISGYLERLLEQAGLNQEAIASALFAIHPGGPKIIDQIADHLSLSEEQIRHSRSVLRDYGNMSSATLPHIWERILRDTTIAPNTLVVTMAFGPGLTIAGAILQKR